MDCPAAGVNSYPVDTVLPQKLLVWEEDGTVNVTYNDPQYLSDRHDIEGEDERLTQIASVLDGLATGEDSP
ncbi:MULTISPECIES: DUF302 domain-containing protein [unclassified Haladaptatus]|uniref:DUF302 domain-containing protein n=1 Tax=unclassified Haladaptatus TaxID=2622732 RepID=UPI0023E873C8|nr:MULTISPECIES: DUF302 domain-containing protein [unclassified Haladaptatus]